MANSITKQTLVDGPRNLIVKVTIEGEAAGSDETDTVLIDASTYTPAFTDCRLKLLHSNLSGFTAKLYWDATTNVLITTVPDYESHYDNDEVGHFGGFVNNAGTGVTGDILISTTGLGVAADYGTMIFHIIKKGVL